jgi:hypothetical protein
VTKIVYNRHFGGFHLDHLPKKKLWSLGSPYVQQSISDDYRVHLENGVPVKTQLIHYKLDYQIPRHDPLLVQVVEELIAEMRANNVDERDIDLAVIDIPGNLYWIVENSGCEHVWTPQAIEAEWVDASKPPSPTARSKRGTWY